MATENNTPSWEQRYQQGKTGWDRGKCSPNLIKWLEQGELKPCRVLVPGCGNGYEVLEFAQRGFDVVAVDIAPSAVGNVNSMLAKHNLTAQIIEADLFQLDFTGQPVDAIYEQTCLCALAPTQWQDYEQWLYQSLKEGGKLYAQFMQTGKAGGPPYHCDMSEMKTLFATSRWEWQQSMQPEPMIKLENAQESPYLLIKK